MKCTSDEMMPDSKLRDRPCSVVLEPLLWACISQICSQPNHFTWEAELRSLGSPQVVESAGVAHKQNGQPCSNSSAPYRQSSTPSISLAANANTALCKAAAKLKGVPKGRFIPTWDSLGHRCGFAARKASDEIKPHACRHALFLCCPLQRAALQGNPDLVHVLG